MHKPFNLEKALAGKPIIYNGKKAYLTRSNRDQSKVFIEFAVPNDITISGGREETITREFDFAVEFLSIEEVTKMGNLLKMWEKSQRITLNLPKPLNCKERREEYSWGIIYTADPVFIKSTLGAVFGDKNVLFFDTEEEAKEWIDAMKKCEEQSKC